MERQEFLRLNAAHATGRNAFCVSFDEGDPDDQFSIVLSYDGRYPQPWSRVNVPRHVCSIVDRVVDGRSVYVAMSDEGDVYFLNDDETVHEKIPGSGLYSPDARDYGAMSVLLPFGEEMVALGYASQAYVRDGEGSWAWLTEGGIRVESDFLGFDCIAAAEAGESSFIATGSARRVIERMSDEIGELIEEAGWKGDLDELNRLYDSLGADTKPDAPQTHHYVSGIWRRLAMPRDVPLRGAFAESERRIWLVGLEGAIFLGNPQDGFRDVAFRGNTDDLYSITRFRTEMILTSGYGLHRFDGHLLSDLKPKLDPKINAGVPTPLKVQTTDDVMFYFDTKHGVCRWDGAVWDWIEIPPELLEREFAGLPR